MRTNGFRNVSDRYYRGNSRWSKVVRLHDKVGEPVNGVQQWRPKYSVAFGNQGEVLAFKCDRYLHRKTAEKHAKQWVA